MAAGKVADSVVADSLDTAVATDNKVGGVVIAEHSLAHIVSGQSY